MRWESLRDKSTYRRVLRYVRMLKTWQLVVLLLIGLIVSASLLRLNNLAMVERRTAVITADEKGDKAALQKSIVELQHYVSHHMNTSLGSGFFLSKTYERDRDAALEAAGQDTNPNSAVYQQASVECQARWQGGRESFRNDYVQCVIDRVGALGAQASAAPLNLPKADAYRVSFSSPLWTPDLAGLAVLVCVLITLVIIGRALLVFLLRWQLKRHYRST